MIKFDIGVSDINHLEREFLLYSVISLIFALAILPFAAGIIPLVHFTSEKIDVHVYSEEVRIDGHYFYRNPFPFPVMQGFSIPFPTDVDHPEPFAVQAERLSPAKETLMLRRIFGKTGFELYFSAHEEIEVTVTYRQKSRTGNATYILTTTRPWGKPLDHGVYTLSSHGAVIVTSNYPFNLDNNVLGFYMSNFMPEKDWQFAWRKTDDKESRSYTVF